MNQFLKISLSYFAIASLVAFIFRDNAAQAVSGAMELMGGASALLFFMTFTFVCLGLIGNAILQTKAPRDTVVDAFKATIATAFFQAAFMISKTTMPYIIPFYADPFFARIDEFLHLGTAPWVIAHDWGRFLPTDKLAGVYLYGWMWPAILLPITLATLDSNPDRVRRMMLLYVSAWIVVGNIMALSGMSAGPIFYDRLYGGDQFALLPASFAPIGPNMEAIRSTQESLWITYVDLDQVNGTGISAFPSVHLSVATLTAIYVYERWRYTLPIVLVGVAAILYMSVYTGYHYAVDGYVSIAFILGLWLYLRRRDQSAVQYA
ncbi:phosphatase PAP2 family protein [Aliiroseovarius sp. S2029]|uniref:phosphatase PAP2 family protein n=1 Tax=Aliiroseovarius sp. S2029 TaxID=2936988 RepID=UPI0020C11356|nr:phosphatase PAP2 family protein [Aliiroseovarius sp. S2029]MCK8483506.1 phosphatase PAP2 family protein [Aliiroseovarius sp. S2029]